MNTSLIKNYNMRVKPEDTCFFVGDFCFKSGVGCEKAEHWLNQLNGHKIMIKGNHDGQQNGLKTYIDSVYITFANKRIKLVHKPEHSDPVGAEINVIGHIHNKWKIRTFKEHYDIIEKVMSNVLPSDRQDWTNFLNTQAKNRDSKSILINCGVDVWQYRPVLLDELISYTIKYEKGLVTC